MLRYQLVNICYSSPQLLDLCILDVNSLDFQYRTLAAAALCHYTSIEIVKKASGKMPLQSLALWGREFQKLSQTQICLRWYWFTKLQRPKPTWTLIFVLCASFPSNFTSYHYFSCYKNSEEGNTSSAKELKHLLFLLSA